MEIRKFDVEIEGTRPLLQHRYVPEIVKTSKKIGKQVDYRQKFLDAIYYDKKVGVFAPSSYIEGCMIKAATDFRVEGKGKKSYKDFIKGAVVVEPVKIPLGIKTPPEKLFEDSTYVDIRLGKLQGKNAINIVRPIFEKWKLTFKILISLDESLLPTLIVKEILEYAGLTKGIGDYHPKFGAFKINKFKQIN